MKYQILIVDDEPPARKLLIDYVSKVGMLELAGVCSNGEEAMVFLKEKPVDILLLDIRMPLMTGMDLLDELVEKPLTIFVTAYEEYAVKGYELDVIDYLMKPVSFERFRKAIDKAVEYLSVQVATEEKREILDYFFIKTDTRIVKFLFEEIQAIEAQREYIKIITPTRKVMSLVSLTSIANALPGEFVRIHRSFIINMRHIDEVQSNEVLIGEELYPISRNYREDFFKKLGDRKLL
ncbi:LytR/AlgR family response regulator transcription factor [Echinicola vietnamensis]|uniref:Response regulator of the LytR/AlgR family n=1 Tax=Echinicola vietnamensis (strain DSM 17526 / LMG 23754 / KMM 6221) TaxID=926556 RepID=L0G494_ECHVK|nr:LytTR family DNA-binding domain-containing protein [Echinicola vietnamensis]AGA80357.1 response regulator of the LytR/AlgR family [Echinicola vietnamensis DSM 17526]